LVVCGTGGVEVVGEEDPVFDGEKAKQLDNGSLGENLAVLRY
jgi:hypothetical protein